MKTKVYFTRWASGLRCRVCKHADYWHEFAGVCTECGSPDLQTVGVRKQVEEVTQMFSCKIKMLSVEVKE